MFENTVVDKKKKALFCVAAVVCAMALPRGAEARKVADKDGGPKKELLGNVAGVSREPSQVAFKDGAAFIDQWLKAAQSFEDYSFNYKQTVYKSNGSTITESGKLDFKRPHLLRIQELTGPKAGSVAVLQADGQVRGHMGGGLKFFVATLSPDSGMLKSINGWPMVKTDFISLAQAVQGYIKEGNPSKVSETPITVADHPNKVYDWYESRADGSPYKHALFDPTTMQPIEWWDYVQGKLFAHSTWTNFQPNQGLTDKTFTIKGGT